MCVCVALMLLFKKEAARGDLRFSYCFGPKCKYSVRKYERPHAQEEVGGAIAGL